MGAARHDDRVDAGPFANPARRRLRAFACSAVELGDRLGFRTVRGQHGGAGVALDVERLRIDDHGNPAGAGERDDAADHAGGQHALGVVGQDHRIHCRESPLEMAGDVVRLGLSQILLPFDVETHDLLAVRDEAGLDCRGDARPAQEIAVDSVLRDQRAGDQLRGLVFAQGAHEGDPAAQSRDVSRDIACPAEHDRFRLKLENRDRRLG